jgi:hypothetical protein
MRKSVVFFLLLSLNLSAKDVEIPIGTLIEKINSAEGDDRRNLMNSLKLRLRRVNSENRRKIIMELKGLSKRGEQSGKYQTNSRHREHRREPIYRQTHHHRHYNGGHR